MRKRIFQSTLPVGEATDFISESSFLGSISIHASRGGSDIVATFTLSLFMVFQSTLPVGEATKVLKGEVGEHVFQSTLPMGEATSRHCLGFLFFSQFQSTLPVGEATSCRVQI